MNLHRLIVVSLCIALWVGCSRSEPVPPASPVTQPTIVVTPQPPPPPPPVVVADPAAQTAAPPANPTTSLQGVKVGVGVKGHYGGEGFVVTPVASLFAVRERMAFEIQIPQAMQLFKASEDRLPKSHEEFMERIIKENHIQLPQLPEGSRYLYDPKTGELMVESPASK
jgi:hypothetical protein